MKLDTSSYYPKSSLGDDDFSDISDASYVSDASDVSHPQDSTQELQKEPDLPPTEAESFVTKLSHLLSWVLVPLMMPIYGIMLAFGLSILTFTPLGTRVTFTFVVAGINVVIPAVMVLLLKRFGIVQDVGLNGRKERFFPYIISIICLVATAFFLARKGAPLWLTMFFYGGAAAGLVELIINQWWKISAHAAGIAGVVALLVHLFMGDYIDPATEVWLLIAVGLAGLLGSARIWLGRHTLAQVLCGYLVGFCAVFFMMMA